MKLKFTATFGDFLIRLLLWIGVTVITFGIGGIWVTYDSIKWVVEHI